MKFLSIDSATPYLSVALLDQNQPLSQQQITHHPPDPNPVLGMVDTVLRDAGCLLSAVDGFVLTVGPGSFTGLRVGLSLVKGFVLATEKPVVGINTLEAWAACCPSGDRPVCGLLDARKGEVYYSRFLFKNGTPVSLEDEGVTTPEELAHRIQEPTVFIGTGLDPYRDVLQSELKDLFLEGTFKNQISPAIAAGQLAAGRFEAAHQFDLGQLQLHYIRRPEAEQNLLKQNLAQ